ncbi:LAFE_0F01046g1_1 [Lachancea fermentati]|uniref:LAFE_0F01046g1_1 n=1 Tax=Lachancea fermentati TaxID=4955 RepID=A0A1G4MEL7_LACFM|nr:LAFE_0F01046g1_1 [Lachancea fermentati]
MIDTTPKKSGSKDIGDRLDLSPTSPQTPSPPNSKNRRSSTTLSFLPSPSQHGNRHGTGIVIPNSPSVKSRLLPPTTPKSKHTELFLSPSPKLKSPGVYKDSEKPIREISNNLKTRLNYAFVKLQNGWVDKTLPELESELSSKQGKQSPQRNDRLRRQAESGNEEDKDIVATKRTSTYSNQFVDLQEVDSNSAHAAFLNALASPKKKQRSMSSTSIGWSKSPQKLPPITTSGNQPSEVEAIETLMSLSSPKKQSHSGSIELSLPTQPSLGKQPDQPRLDLSSRSSSTSSLQNTLAKPFLLKNDNQVLLDVETDIEEQDDDNDD